MSAAETSRQLFDPRVLFGVIFTGLLAVAGIVWLLAFGDLQGGTGLAGRNSYSVAATGHKATVELLRRQGWPVLSSRYDSPAKAGGGLLVLAEPTASALEDNPGLKFGDIGDFLLVLPKRFTIPDPTRPSWALAAEPIDPEQIAEAAELFGLVIDLSRQDKGDMPDGWENRLGAGVPSLRQAQLMQARGDMTPLIWSAQGVLLANIERGGRRITVLSDPDLIANHGLDDGDNAAIMLALFERLVPPGQPIVFDETIHGFVEQPNPLRRLFVPPLLPVTLSLIAAGLLFGWSAATRFGAARRARRAFELGKSVLIGNTAELLVHGGYRGAAVRSYFENARREVAETLQAPDFGPGQLAGWLEQVGERRRVRTGFIELERRVSAIGDGRQADSETLIATTRDIHAWRQEMLHGSRRDQTDR